MRLKDFEMEFCMNIFYSVYVHDGANVSQIAYIQKVSSILLCCTV